MKFGGSMFFTDYSMGPAELAVALEERGFDIVWAPEHSHIPMTRKTPFIMGGDLPKRYYDVMDPFVTLTAAAFVPYLGAGAAGLREQAVVIGDEEQYFARSRRHGAQHVPQHRHRGIRPRLGRA